MLRRDGYVKVLDFGLAKLTEQHEPAAQAQAAENVNISSRLVMGTVKYMSPEQTRGLEIDARSDIFSFGLVLYEMVTGHAPFEGETTNDLVAAVQKEEPAPLAEYLPQADQELQRIISKTLRKDKVERYPTTRELLTDLRNLKDALEIESKLHRSAEPTDKAPISTRDSQVALTGITKAIATAPSVEYLLGSIKDHKTGRPTENSSPWRERSIPATLF